MGVIRVNLSKKVEVPTALLEDLLSIHPAVDMESGHIVCHYSTFSLLTAETKLGPVPLIASECILLTVGADNVEKLIQDSKPGFREAVVKPGGLIRVGSTELQNPEVVELLLSDTKLELSFYEVEIEGVGKGVVIVAKQSNGKGEPIAVIAVNCKPGKGEEKREALHY